MAKFKITEFRPATQVWTYIVEADNANQALELVQDGNIDAVDYELEDDGCESAYDYAELTEQLIKEDKQ